MATSTIVGFKAALVAALRARPALAGVQVSWSLPHSQPEPDWIYVGDAKAPADQDAAALGRQRREEHYVMHLEVNVARPFADDPQVIAERASALVAEIEDELRDDCTVGGTVRVAQVVGVGLEEGTDGNERWAVMPIRLDVRERI